MLRDVGCELVGWQSRSEGDNSEGKKEICWNEKSCLLKTSRPLALSLAKTGFLPEKMLDATYHNTEDYPIIVVP